MGQDEAFIWKWVTEEISFTSLKSGLVIQRNELVEKKEEKQNIQACEISITYFILFDVTKQCF